MRFHALAAVTMLTLAGFAAQSEAATLSARIYEDSTLQSLGGSSDNGQLIFTGATTNFMVTLNSFGTPIIPQPSLIGQTTQISSNTDFSTPRTLRIEVTQTGLDSASAGGLFAQLATTFTANLLLGNGNISSVTISTYADASNTPYGIASVLASNTYTSGSPQAAGPFISSVSLGNPLFSETLVISATFTGSGATLQTSTQIVGVPTAVPEPATLALFSTGLIAMGMVSRRRRRQG